MSRYLRVVHFHSTATSSGFWSRLFASNSGKANLDPTKTLSFEEFEKYRKEKSATIIDLRQPDELSGDGVIPNSTNIPLGELESAFKMDNVRFEEKYGISKPARADPVIFFCRKGIRAKEGSDFIRWGMQYTNTTTYSGILDWKANTEKM